MAGLFYFECPSSVSQLNTSKTELRTRNISRADPTGLIVNVDDGEVIPQALSA